MTLLSWTLVGLGVGIVSALLANGHRLLEDVVVAVVGAIVGGWLFLAISGGSVTVLSVADTIAALVTSVLLLVLAKGLTRGRTAI